MSILTVAVIVAVWATARHPDPEADADAAVDPPSAQPQEVRSISLDGHQLPLSRLRSVLETHTGEQIDHARIDRDRDAMERALSDLGYLAARVQPAAITFDAVGAAYVTFEIDKGKLFHLRNVEVTGAGKDAAIVTLSPGDDAVRTRIDHARQALSDGLARRGKPTTVELAVHTDLAAAAVDVTLATR
jgi:outer membrane protein assembly factor BamA